MLCDGNLFWFNLNLINHDGVQEHTAHVRLINANQNKADGCCVCSVSLSRCKMLTAARLHCGALMDAPGFTRNTPRNICKYGCAVSERFSLVMIAKRSLTRSWPWWLLSNRAASLLIWGRLSTALSCSCEQPPPPFNPLPFSLLPTAPLQPTFPWEMEMGAFNVR